MHYIYIGFMIAIGFYLLPTVLTLLFTAIFGFFGLLYAGYENSPEKFYIFAGIFALFVIYLLV